MAERTIPQDILKGFRVLVVDDEPDAARVCQLLLLRYSAEVRVAEDGAAGLQAAREYQPDFLLSDISMPEMSGYQLIMEMRKDRLLASIPAIAITAHAMPGNREKAIAAGFDDYLTKPLRPRIFIHDLLAFLRRFPHLAERFGSLD